ncbi:MAG: DEAD/DEAH box helicase, partial [Bacteroidales bacterium]|nr:DEAD/DEAH box helicase [Bacteroidales bacterium]
VLQRINPSINAPQTLILCPTRELCVQIAGDLNDLAKYKEGIRLLPVYGGASIENQIQQLKKGVQIIVATPGRLIDLIGRRAVKINAVSQIILDEADEMLNMGFTESIDEILSFIPGEHSTLLFSATMPPAIASISKNYMKNPREVTIGTRNSGAEMVKHQYYVVHAKDKYLALKRIIDYAPNMYGIIFCRTRKETQEVADLLIKDGYNADSLHGELSQAQRDYVMQRFRLKNIQLLVATDVAARGLDVEDLTHIIHYQLPNDVESYTHRSGRTGRAGKTGISIAILHLKERHLIRPIEKTIGKTFTEEKIPTGQDICQKQLFNLIDKIEKVEQDDSAIAEFLPAMMKKLDWLSKEDIIRRFVALEFDRLFNYYKDAHDLDSPRDQKRSKDSRENEDRNNSRKPEKGFTRLYINIGKLDGAYPNHIIGLINEFIPGRKIYVGKIELTKTCSFFEVEDGIAKSVIQALNKAYYYDRKVEVRVADGMPSGKSGGRDRGRKKFRSRDRD